MAKIQNLILKNYNYNLYIIVLQITYYEKINIITILISINLYTLIHSNINSFNINKR